MRKYWAIYKMRLQTTFMYRGSVIIYRLGNLLFLAMIVAVWFSAQTRGLAGGYSQNELVTYYLIGSFLNSVVLWSSTSGIREEINSGEINTKTLTKPISYYWQKFFEEFGWHTISPIFAVITVLLVAIILRNNLQLLFVPTSLVLMLLATIFAAILFFNISTCLGLLSFWFVEIGGVTSLLWMGVFLLGGQAIPTTFFPDTIRVFVELLPFRYLYSFPIEVYFGKLPWSEVGRGFSLQVFWILITVLLFKIIWQKGLARYSSYGG